MDTLLLPTNREVIKVFENKELYLRSCNNMDAIKNFKQKINTLKFFIKNKDLSLLSQVSNIIFNLELLTNIESESDANYLGKYNPTKNDIKAWQHWFKKNKDNICFVRESNVLYNLRGVNPFE